MLTFQESGKGKIVFQHLPVSNYKKIFLSILWKNVKKYTHYDIFCKLQTFPTMYPYLVRV